MLPERILHSQICEYLKLQYRDVLFRTDFAAGEKLSMHQAIRNKQLQAVRGWPDIFISEPRGQYHGLFIELKEQGTKLFLKDGSFTTNAHLKEQQDVLDMLTSRGYMAVFCVGFEQTKQTIDDYLASPLSLP